MSLEKFIGSRLVVLSPNTHIYDEVRSMLDNRICAVLMHDGAALAGIVTDRALGLEMLANDLDASELQLSDPCNWLLPAMASRKDRQRLGAAADHARARRAP